MNLDVNTLFMVAQSDQALYFAKEKGRNRVEVTSLNMVMDRKPDAPAAPAKPSAAVAAKTAAA